LKYITLGKPRGPVWGHFKVLEQSKTGTSKMVCLHCDYEYWDGLKKSGN